MSKSLKIFLAVLALISVGLSLSIVFDWNPFIKIKTQLMPKPSPTPTPAIVQQLSPDFDYSPQLKELPTQDKTTIVLPVEENYLEGAIVDPDYPQVLSFYLEPGEPIRAIFKGKIKQINRGVQPFPEDNAFDEIILDREDGQFYASYVIYGEVLVNEGDIIEQDQEIAKAKEGGLGFRSGTNLSLWIHSKDGEMMKVTKDLFSK